MAYGSDAAEKLKPAVEKKSVKIKPMPLPEARKAAAIKALDKKKKKDEQKASE